MGRTRIPREKPEFESNTPPTARQCAGETGYARSTPTTKPSPLVPSAVGIALGCALLSGGSCGVALLDYGAHVDGPGIGLEWSKPLGSEYGFALMVVLASIFINGLLSLFAWSRSGAKPIGQLALCGLWFLGLIGGVAGGARALPAWWKLGCHRGHAFACHAAAGVTDGAESKALDARACAGGVERACPREPSPP